MFRPPMTTTSLWRIHPGPVERLELEIPTTIGRGSNVRLRLADEDVSRFHAAIELRNGGVCIADQGSRNGVYSMGRRVGVTRLEPGAVIRLGQTVFWQEFEPTFSAIRERLVAELAL